MARPCIAITKQMCKAAEVLAAQGLTKTQIAASLGFSRDTLHRKEKEFSEFSDAIKKGQARGIAKISNALFDAALAGNVTAMIFYLKNRSPETWCDKPRPDSELEVPQAIKVTVIDGRQLTSPTVVKT